MSERVLERVKDTRLRFRTDSNHNRQNSDRFGHPIDAIYHKQDGLAAGKYFIPFGGIAEPVQLSDSAESKESIETQQLQHYILLDLEEQNSQRFGINNNLHKQHGNMYPFSNVGIIEIIILKSSIRAILEDILGIGNTHLD